jgi:hypothetical protein
MVSAGYQLCRQAGRIHISITMPAIGSRGIKIATQILRLMLFLHAAGFMPRVKRKTAGFPPPS